DDFDELGGVGIEIDHVAGLAGGLGAGVHGHADVGLGQGGGVVGAVADHGDEFAALLLLADAGQFVLGFGLGDVIVHTGLGGDGGGGEVVVAGDHDGADAHFAELGEALLDAAFDNVLELDEAEGFGTVGHEERRGALAGDFLNFFHEALVNLAAVRADIPNDGLGGAFANGADGLRSRRGPPGRHRSGKGSRMP